MSQKHQKFMHFLREHFEFATDICSSDITSAAIALRFCVELLQCEFTGMVSEADSDVREEYKVLLNQSEELLSVIQHPAHFQYDFLERRYGGSISAAEFKDVRQRLFHLIKEYIRHIQYDGPFLSWQDVSVQDDSEKELKDLFIEYIHNFQSYKKSMSYPYVAVVNFRKSLEAFFRVKLDTLDKQDPEFKYNAHENKFSQLNGLGDAFFNENSGYASLLKSSEKTYLKNVIYGPQNAKRSDAVLNKMCHFGKAKVKKQEEPVKIEVDYNIWDDKTQEFNLFTDRLKLFEKQIDEYRDWFIEICHKWEEVTDIRVRPAKTKNIEDSAPETSQKEEPLKVEEPSFQTTPKVSDGTSKRSLMLVPFAILLGAGGWFLMQEQPALQSVPSSKSTLQKSKRTIPVKRQQKVFSTTVSVDKLPLKERKNRFDKEAKRELLKKAQRSGYKRMIGELKYDGKMPKCSSLRCSWEVEARFTK